jgi:hypothetical protein
MPATRFAPSRHSAASSMIVNAGGDHRLEQFFLGREVAVDRA